MPVAQKNDILSSEGPIILDKLLILRRTYQALKGTHKEFLRPFVVTMEYSVTVSTVQFCTFCSYEL